MLDPAMVNPTSTSTVMMETFSSTPNAFITSGDLSDGTRLKKIRIRHKNRKATPATDRTSDIACPESDWRALMALGSYPRDYRTEASATLCFDCDNIRV